MTIELGRLSRLHTLTLYYLRPSLHCSTPTHRRCSDQYTSFSPRRETNTSLLSAINYASRISVVPDSKADNVIASSVVGLVGDQAVSQL